MENITSTSWYDLKKKLRPLQGKSIFELERNNSMNDGKFLRVLHKVEPHKLVFFDGVRKIYLEISKEQESNIKFFENGFSYLNCTYTLKQVMEV